MQHMSMTISKGIPDRRYVELELDHQQPHS